MKKLEKIYMYNGVEGVIISLGNVKVAGLEPVIDDCEYGFYSLSQLDGRDVDDSDTTLAYDDSYAGSYQGDAEVVADEVVNVENEQRLIYRIVTDDYAKSDYAERNLVTTTDQYYQWKSDRTSTIDAIRTDIDAMYESGKSLGEIKEYWRKEWDNTCSQYDTTCVLRDISFDLLWEESCPDL